MHERDLLRNRLQAKAPVESAVAAPDDDELLALEDRSVLYAVIDPPALEIGFTFDADPGRRKGACSGRDDHGFGREFESTRSADYVAGFGLYELVRGLFQHRFG